MSIEVIDIIPPQKVKEKKPIPFKASTEEVRKKRGKKKIIFFLFLIILIIGGISYGQIFSKVEIEIWPKMENIEFNTAIIINTKQDEVDLTAEIIPGYILEEQNFLIEQFSSSGKIIKENKAEGTIRIFNDYSALSMPLRENTRFMAASGKIFRTPVSIVIPGKKTEKGKEVAGFVDAKVIADESGPDYNIEPTTFSIPGLVGTASYTKIYGKSFETMKGGFKGEALKVTEEDLKKAELSTVQKLKEEGRKILERKAIDSSSVFLEEIFWQETQSTSSSVTVETETDKFDFSAGVKSAILLFKKEDLMELIFNQLSIGKRIYEKTLITDWNVKKTDLNQGEAVFDLTVKGEIYSDIGAGFKKELEKKTLYNAQMFLEQKPEISKVKINSWPFWLKKIPKNPEKIEIKLNFNSISS